MIYQYTTIVSQYFYASFPCLILLVLSKTDPCIEYSSTRAIPDSSCISSIFSSMLLHCSWSLVLFLVKIPGCRFKPHYPGDKCFPFYETLFSKVNLHPSRYGNFKKSNSKSKKKKEIKMSYRLFQLSHIVP